MDLGFTIIIRFLVHSLHVTELDRIQNEMNEIFLNKQANCHQEIISHTTMD